MIMKTQASLDADGNVIDWNYDLWSSSHGMRPGDDAPSSGLIAAWHRAVPMPSFPNEPSSGRHSSGHRTADPLYAFPQRRIVKHYVKGMPLSSEEPTPELQSLMRRAYDVFCTQKT